VNNLTFTRPMPTFATALRRVRERGRPLWRCTRCDSELMQAVGADAPRPGLWRVKRRCPECGRHDMVEAGVHALDAFDEQLLAGHEELLSAYRRISGLTMREDAERIVAALRADALQPFDF